jgi:hypothetical protein
LIFDRSGKLYVADHKIVTVYAPGATAPLRTISRGIKNPVRWHLTAAAISLSRTTENIPGAGTR